MSYKKFIIILVRINEIDFNGTPNNDLIYIL